MDALPVDSPATRRLKAVQSHLLSDSDGGGIILSQNFTSVAFFYGGTQDMDTVSAWSPLRPVSRLPDHPDIKTLHDNFTRSAEAFRYYKYLGTRVHVDGTVGQ